MVTLPNEIKELLPEMELFPFATASATGVPNVVPVKFVYLARDDVFWVTDNFFNKTLANLRENPRAALYVWSASAKRSYQIKGDTEIVTSGSDYEAMKAMVLAKKPDAPVRSLVIFRITAVYDCMPGSGAGRQVL